MSRLVTLDSSVLVKLVIDEEGSELAERLVHAQLDANDPIVAPGWAWAEVGSALRRHVRRAAIPAERATDLWRLFLEVPVMYLDEPAIRERTWSIAVEYGLPTLYDATFLAVTELAAGPAERSFWTADAELVRRLGRRRPTYVHLLSELA
jgi:predicted nucleic acid-binding protein